MTSDHHIWVYDLLIAILAMSCVLPILRMKKGPTLADRAICFDNLVINTAGMLALISIRQQTDYFVEAILIMALLGFLGTLSIARFIERGQLIVSIWSHPGELARKRAEAAAEEEKRYHSQLKAMEETEQSTSAATTESPENADEEDDLQGVPHS